MQQKHIHIVSFDVPFPADYGGVIDVFNKIKALKSKDFIIHLHCFEYGRGKPLGLEKYCKSVNYMSRKTGFWSILSFTPYIIRSRRSKTLLREIAQDDFPVIFEGLHCCYYLDNKLLSDKIKIVRTHNIEHQYYKHLASAEKNFWKKLFFLSEALKLKFYEKKLCRADTIAAISSADKKHFSQYSKSYLVPAFHSEYIIQQHSGLGQGIVYHGNMSVGENIKVAIYLIKNVFAHTDKPCIIAGKNPDTEILQTASRYTNVKIIANPSDEKLEQLIKNAQINILITFQATGIKLKLLNALSLGRHCIVNDKMVAGTGLETLCHIADNSEKILKLIGNLYSKEYNINNDEYKKRELIFKELFSNSSSANKLIDLLYKK